MITYHDTRRCCLSWGINLNVFLLSFQLILPELDIIENFLQFVMFLMEDFGISCENVTGGSFTHKIIVVTFIISVSFVNWWFLFTAELVLLKALVNIPGLEGQKAAVLTMRAVCYFHAFWETICIIFLVRIDWIWDPFVRKRQLLIWNLCVGNIFSDFNIDIFLLTWTKSIDMVAL